MRLPVRWGCLSVLAALVLASPPDGSAQALPLRDSLPPLPPGLCEMAAAEVQGLSPTPSSAAEEAEARVAAAGQAAILGDPTQALALLREAASLDPGSDIVRYRLARALDEAGEGEAAVEEYCRYLALAPVGPEAPEVRGRLAGTAAFQAREEELQARAAWEEGVRAYQVGSYDQAALAFSRALVLRPDWAEAHYNRAVAYLGSGRTGAAVADLEWYLELHPDAPDRAAVAGSLVELRAVPIYSAGTALATGLLVPGLGHFYSGRTGMGLLVLTAAGGSAATGLLYREVEIRCLGLPVGGECPPAQVASRTESRPYLAAGLGVAAGLTIVGAIHAYRSVRGRNAPVALSVRDGHLLVPVGGPDGSGSWRFGLDRGEAGVRVGAGLHLAF